MSLSALGKLFALVAFFFASGWMGREYALPTYTYLTEGRSIQQRDARISKRSVVYRVPADTGVTFAFSQPVIAAKILVHPAVKPELHGREQGFVYGLRMRWIDAGGNELEVHEIFVQAASPDDVFESGETWRFYRDQPELIAEQDTLFVESRTPATWLEVEAFDLDSGIIGIDLKVFEQRAYIGNQPLTIFRRLNEDSKALLTKANAFSDSMLTEEEQFNLGKNYWRPVGPLGIGGRDYAKFVLYEAAIRNAALAAEDRE